MKPRMITVRATPNLMLYILHVPSLVNLLHLCLDLIEIRLKLFHVRF